MSKIEPLSGTFADMCKGDIRILQELPTLYQVISTISDTGEPCIEVDRSSRTIANGRVSNDYTHLSKSKYCNNTLTFTTPDTTIVNTGTTDLSFWQTVVDSYVKTDVEIRNDFLALLTSLRHDGAIITQDSLSVTIVQTNDQGEQITSVYNKINTLLLHTEIKNAAGEVTKTFAYEYTCNPDGKIIPKTIYIISNEVSGICQTPFIKKQWMMYENYLVTI